MTSISVSGSLPISAPWTARLSIGVVSDGFVQPAGGLKHDVEPGGLVAFGVERQVRAGDGLLPAIDLSIFLSTSWLSTVTPATGARTRYFAADARLGGRAAWRLGRHSYPYLATRVFGGPVSWEWEGQDVLGSDIHHVKVAAGVAAQWGRLGLFGEWAGFGEQGISAGVSTVW